MAVLGYLPKLGLGLVFCAHFLRDFRIKVFLIQYSIYGKSFSVIPFDRQKISKFLLRQLMTS